MEGHEGFGERVPVLAEAGDWQLPRFKHPESCRVSVFRAHQTAQEKRRPRGLCVPDDEVFISAVQRQKDGCFWLNSSPAVIIRGSKMGLLSGGLCAGWAELSGALWEGEMRVEGWAEIREDGADGSRNLCSGFTALPRQTCSVTPKRCSSCSPANTWEGTSFNAQPWQQDQ